ncbi:hypothetical protein CLF_105438 [Clonorchis sinensis]|uniref:Uncharacterized protein n=1 Tax=Clonorchis sinensis TaxID=79923 RepID=G7YPB0_CLOSI|nr:hypothetical protein CLF_105438 [Clonorchis sinensis]
MDDRHKASPTGRRRIIVCIKKVQECSDERLRLSTVGKVSWCQMFPSLNKSHRVGPRHKQKPWIDWCNVIPCDPHGYSCATQDHNTDKIESATFRTTNQRKQTMRGKKRLRYTNDDFYAHSNASVQQQTHGLFQQSSLNSYFGVVEKWTFIGRKYGSKSQPCFSPRSVSVAGHAYRRRFNFCCCRCVRITHVQRNCGNISISSFIECNKCTVSLLSMRNFAYYTNDRRPGLRNIDAIKPHRLFDLVTIKHQGPLKQLLPRE